MEGRRVSTPIWKNALNNLSSSSFVNGWSEFTVQFVRISVSLYLPLCTCKEKENIAKADHHSGWDFLPEPGAYLCSCLSEGLDVSILCFPLLSLSHTSGLLRPGFWLLVLFKLSNHPGSGDLNFLDFGSYILPQDTMGHMLKAFYLFKLGSCLTDLLMMDNYFCLHIAGSYKWALKCESLDWCEWNRTDSVLVLSLPHVHQSLFLLKSLSLYLPGQWSCSVKMMCSAICSILKNARNAPACPVSSIQPPRIRHTYTQLAQLMHQLS